MESFKEFLATASISGLNHISSTRRWARLFWITLVTLGFVMSSFLIWESFQSWADNPVRTTTRTVPMKEIKFPKLTVCPPKNTFTDLNYDLMLAENVTLTNEKKNQLYEHIVAIIDEHVYMDPWDKLHEEKRFFNWYTGFTSMHFEPHYSELNFYEVDISTSATSGVFTTQYFGESFDPKAVENKQDYVIKLWPARSIRYNENVTLHLKIERLILPVLGGFDDLAVSIYEKTRLVDVEFNYNYTPPTSIPAKGLQMLTTSRDISDGEIAEANLKLMPGFQLSWYYTGMDFKPDPLMDFPIWRNQEKYSKLNKEFVREVFSKDRIIFK